MRTPTIGPSMVAMPPIITMKRTNAVQSVTEKAASGEMRRLLQIDRARLSGRRRRRRRHTHKASCAPSRRRRSPPPLHCRGSPTGEALLERNKAYTSAIVRTTTTSATNGRHVAGGRRARAVTCAMREIKTESSVTLLAELCPCRRRDSPIGRRQGERLPRRPRCQRRNMRS